MFENFVSKNKNFFFGVLVGAASLLIIYLSIINSNTFGTLADWVSGIGTILAIVFTVNIANKSNKDNIILSEYNRSTDIYVQDLRKIVELEKNIIDGNLIVIEGISINNIEYNELFNEVVRVQELKYTNNESENMMLSKYDHEIVYTIYGMPSDKKKKFQKYIKHNNKILEELENISPDNLEYEPSDKNKQELKDCVADYINNHELILDKAKEELDRYYKIKEL